MYVSRPLVASVGVGILGIALVGLGAGATFTDATHSLQTITAGSIDMTLTSTNTLYGSGTKMLTLPYLGPVGSTFKTDLVPVTMKNNGIVTATETSSEVSTTLPSGYKAADAQLRDQMYVCIVSPATASGAVICDGLVKNAGVRTLAGSVGPGLTDSYSAEFYAGKQNTACTGKNGAAVAGPAGLDNFAQGGTFTPNVTVSFIQ
jgi:hypothetical protein